MSTITYCDRDECRNTDQDMRIYDLHWRLNDINGEVWKAIGMYSKYDNICQDHVDMWNEDYPKMLIVEDDYLRLNKENITVDESML